VETRTVMHAQLNTTNVSLAVAKLILTVTRTVTVTLAWKHVLKCQWLIKKRKTLSFISELSEGNIVHA